MSTPSTLFGLRNLSLLKFEKFENQKGDETAKYVHRRFVIGTKKWDNLAVWYFDCLFAAYGREICIIASKHFRFTDTKG